jgi:hypothetical protein
MVDGLSIRGDIRGGPVFNARMLKERAPSVSHCRHALMHLTLELF